MKCRECDEVFDPADDFCGNCGGKKAPLVCSCGATLKEGKKFCGKCGAKVDAQGPAVVKQEVGPPQLLCCGTKEDGTECRCPLLPDFKFCPVCGLSAQSPPAQTLAGGRCSARKSDGTVCNADLPLGCSSCDGCLAPDSTDSTPFLEKLNTCPRKKENGSICGNELTDGAVVCPTCDNKGNGASTETGNPPDSATGGVGNGASGLEKAADALRQNPEGAVSQELTSDKKVLPVTQDRPVEEGLQRQNGPTCTADSQQAPPDEGNGDRKMTATSEQPEHSEPTATQNPDECVSAANPKPEEQEPSAPQPETGNTQPELQGHTAPMPAPALAGQETPPLATENQGVNSATEHCTGHEKEVCPGKQKDGTPCRAELMPQLQLSFCVSCGYKPANTGGPKQLFAQYAESGPAEVKKEVSSVQQNVADGSTTKPNTNGPETDTEQNTSNKPQGNGCDDASSATEPMKLPVQESGDGQKSKEVAGDNLPNASDITQGKHEDTAGSTTQTNTDKNHEDSCGPESQEGKTEDGGGLGGPEGGEAEGEDNKGPESSVDGGNQEKEDMQGKKKNKQKGKRGHNQGKSAGNDPEMPVVFHVIISNLFEKMDPKKYSVCIRFGPSQLGTFNPSQDKYKLEFKGMTSLGCQYEGKVMMTKQLRNSSFDYKYIVKKNETDRANKDKVIWETVQRREAGKDQNFVDRHFSIPLQRRSSSVVWHRYDGVAYLKGTLTDSTLSRLKGAIGWGTNSKEKVRKDACDCAKLYLPSAVDIHSTISSPETSTANAEGCFEFIYQVMCSLKFQMLDPYLNNLDDAMLERAIKENLISPLLDKLWALRGIGQRTVALSMFVLLLLEEFSIRLETAVLNGLCYCLLIKPDVEHRTCPDLDDLKAQFPDRMKDKGILVKKLHSLIEKTNSVEQTYAQHDGWLFCIPLLHFLQEESVPFLDIDPPSYKYEESVWWGVETVKMRKESFKTAWKYAIVSKEWLQQFKPALSVDTLFARSLVASLDLKPLLPVLRTGLIPLEVMAATLAHHMKEINYLLKEEAQEIEQCAALMVRTFRETDRPATSHQLKKMGCQVVITRDLHRRLLSRKDVTTLTVMEVTHLVLLLLDALSVLEESVKESAEEKFGWTDNSQNVLHGTFVWIANRYSLTYDNRTRSTHLQKLGRMLEIVNDFAIESHRQLVEKMVTENFERELNQLTALQKLDVYVLQENVRPALTQVLNRLAFEAIDSAFEMGFEHFSVRLISLLSDFLEMKWREQVKDDVDILHFVLTWTPMVNYLKNFREKKFMECFSQLASKHIRSSLHCIETIVGMLMTGEINMKVLCALITHQRCFVDIAEVSGQDRKRIEALFMLRTHELTAYETTGNQLQTLIEFCVAYLQTDDLHRLQTQIQFQKGAASDQWLSKVCDIAAPDSIEDHAHYKPRANPWNLTDEVLGILPDFEDKTFSFIFHHIFSERAKMLNLTGLKFWRAFHVVWSDTSQEWKACCDSMVEGSISIEGTKKLFSMFLTGDGEYRWEQVRKELKRIAGNSPAEWIEERISQFQCYLDIQKHVETAKALLQVRDVYQIAGTYDDIEKICSLSQRASMPIRDVDRSLLELCMRLKDFKDQDIICLRSFVHSRCKDFIVWLKENMKGVKELNVFVDLAFITAGEEPWAIGRVNCFHAAATGYAPLIFTEMKSCLQLLQQCDLVFKNVATDPSLPEKLKDTSRNLTWFKGVQKSHGSVEKTSLTQVGNIIDRGVFTIGRVKTEEGMSLHSVLWLLVPEEKEDTSSTDVIEVERADASEDDDDKRPPREYSYEELLDLQSRLMLVTGQQDKGRGKFVDCFIMIMDSLVRLGKTYVQLCADGCVLFKEWTVKFLCDMTRPVCCISEFARQGKLKGRRGKNATLENFIADMANFLEDCHAEWLQHLHEKRCDFPELNIYTVEQLVFLQQQLIRVSSGDVSQLVYPMLSLLKADCTPQDLEDALVEAMDHINNLQQQQVDDCESGEQGQAEREGINHAIMVDFIQEMIDGGFSRALALKAAEEVGCNTSAGLDWCMTHEKEIDEEDMEEAEEVTEERNSSVGERLRGWVTRGQTITESAIGWLENIEAGQRDGSLRTLIKNLKTVWTNFLHTVSSSGTDFISMEHLGIVLKCLATKDTREFQRCLPPTFKPGTPNLILCPSSEVLNAVTYMYMFPENDTSLLPQPDEVLLCTPETTSEQVDIFLRRAFFGKEGKVHCLAFADALDYDVGEKVEKRLKEYTSQAVDRNYQLVVVCTTENEFRARIVAALEKYRRPAPALSSTSSVRKYLKTRFTGVISKGNKQSVSFFDPETLCVRVIKSDRSGVGKTLFKQRLAARLKKGNPLERRDMAITIPLHCRVAHTRDIAAHLLQHTLQPGVVLPRIIHLDIPYQVQEGVDHLLYNLLVLGCVTDAHGSVWLRSPMDLYLVETMPLIDQKCQQRGKMLVHQTLAVLPSLNCWSPQDSLIIMREESDVPGCEEHDQLFDDEEYHSEVYQRPYQYLKRLDTTQQPQPYTQEADAEDKADCLAILLKYCGVQNPSWSELTHFVWFLNNQLQDFERSVYCGMAAGQDLPGFSVFVLRFLIQMSRDFATRSLKIHEESLSALLWEKREDDEESDIQQYQMRRKWESSPHPYIFFNPDGDSMTFLGFSIDAASGNLLDQQTQKVLEKGIMNRLLYQSLIHNRVPLTENFDVLPRQDRLLRLYRVLGLHDEEIFDDNEVIIDPDDTYELTTDNVKKILAIYMRFRCNIPVIVMGETGCGKTRLVKFLCALQTPHDKVIKTMVLVKVHGGTTGEEIMMRVREAEQIAQKNAVAVSHRPVYTVLFFDEANTTEAVGVIKEVMCDGTLAGQPISLNQNLKMVAACNPYRKHSEELIQLLENAGLGYHVDADKTVDKLGRVPMRRLVYRVQPLPQSMLPLVWDFGQLDTQVEEMYIKQMVRRYVRNGNIDDLDEAGKSTLCRILLESQEFMRKLKNECSFVSLRDVDRALTIASWFLEQARETGTLFDKLDQKLQQYSTPATSLDSHSTETEEEETNDDTSDMTKALVLSLGVCYRACLRSKKDYDQHIVQYFRPPFSLAGGDVKFQRIIDCCQEVFLDNVHLEENIARNQALKENVFMMVVCIELRIPLFLVGKPGSSKSLAKTIVSDAMQGKASSSELFEELKQAQMVSFQCSPLATADGILNMFKQCAQYQLNNKNVDAFVSVVVLDEVGLAEDSPKMPLKTLHPLLEEGFPGEDVPEEYRKVAFIGISNWALDPAKMNRGILVQRDVPDKEELVETAKGICATKDQMTKTNMNLLVNKLAQAYLNIFQEAKKKREFFGLRDFYSLVKMVYGFAAKSKRRPSQRQLIAAIRRNFGGLDTVDPVESFQRELPESLCPEKPFHDDPDCSPSGLIKDALKGEDMGVETRYLLLLSENYGGLNILLENLLAQTERAIVRIFGSSFPKDQEYTQICRNINRIKVCMETGQTVILLNLDNLYESLYDALNQYYAMLGGERYVDLGLGTHRVKCKVDKKFRLIVVAEKQAVYDNFPIPLINRLEKHFLTLNNIMSHEQLEMVDKLIKWAQEFVSGGHVGPVTRSMAMSCRAGQKEDKVCDVFMGYHPDTAPAIVLKVWEVLQVDNKPANKSKVLGECQCMLLWCATPDAVIRMHDSEDWSQVYYVELQHDNLAHYLKHRLSKQPNAMLMAQVTTHSKLLTEHERLELCQQLPVRSITLLSLQAFDTEQQFCEQLRVFFGDADGDGDKLLLVQCDSGDTNQNLIQCAQYCMQDMRRADVNTHHVVFIIQLPSITGTSFTGFLGGNWHCLHIDELRAPDQFLPPITQLQCQTPADLLLGVTGGQQEQFNRNNSAEQIPWIDGPEDEVSPHSRGNEERMEVGLDDVQVQLHSTQKPPDNQDQYGAYFHMITSSHQPPDRSQDQPHHYSTFIQTMLTSCVQAAVSLIRDPDPELSRATHRVTIMLKLMEGNTQFFNGVLRMVGGILKEREQDRGHMAEQWLSKEAAKLDRVKKAGTFRRSWQQYLENKVTPVLAGVIAYLDTNANLDILYNTHNDQPAWVQKLWLHILQGDTEVKLTYKHLRSMSDKEELEEFTVQNTSAKAAPLSCQLPFSWLIWELVDSARSSALGLEDDPLDTSGSVVEQSPLGRSLQTAVGGCEEDLTRMFQLYIADLLYFTFPLNPQEHQLMCGCVEKAVRQQKIDLVQLGVGRGLVRIHHLLDLMRPRLQTILDMTSVRPGAILAVVAGTGPHTQFLGVEDEMTEDVVLLTLLIEELQPRPTQFAEGKGCEEWVTQYSSVAPVIIRILGDASIMSDGRVDVNSDVQEEEEEEESEEEEASPVLESLPFGQKCQQQLASVRCLFTRVMTVKLFFDFVSPLRTGPASTQNAIKKVKFYLLWMRLEDDANMKTVKTLQAVDKFLKHASGTMIRGLLGDVGECSYCHKDLGSVPIELPCKHRLCASCLRDCCPSNVPGQCPECGEPVPQSFKTSSTNEQNSEAVQQLSRYQRQISGFLMALVSKLCFVGHEPPERDAVRHIFGYIIHRSKGRTLIQTKQMTVHDDLIDPTPVLRSFLLRLLLRHSEHEVFDHLDEFLKSAEELEQQQQHSAQDQTSSTPTWFEFSLLVIHCIEDIRHEEEAIRTEGRSSLGCDLHQQRFLAAKLHELRQGLESQTVELRTLYALGQFRYALDSCARVLHDVFVAPGYPRAATEDMQHLLQELQLVCQNNWPKKFLIKQLCREFGLQAYVSLVKVAMHEPLLQWIILEEPVQEVQDRYLVCSQKYKVVRDGLAQVKLGGEVSSLKKAMKNLSEDSKEMLVLLAVHREFTMSYLHTMPDDLRAKMVSDTKKFVQSCNWIRHKELAQRLCENSLVQPGSALCVQPGQDLATQGLVCVLTHLFIALRPSGNTCSLLKPLCALIFQPATMTNSFLPTMPQDNLDEIMQVIPGEKVWHCPKGHRYFIGDCGKPYFEGICNTCGAKIGGIHHNPAPQNALDTGVDQTQRGHILGAAAQRGTEALPERQLSAAENAFLRFITHTSLYLGATIPGQATQIGVLVQPRVHAQTEGQFFWDHLQRDMQVLQRVTGRSVDDVFLVLHHLCHLMTTKQTGGQAVHLTSKQERVTWERQFATSFIAPTVQTIDKIIHDGNKAVVSDTRLGDSELLKVVYEVEMGSASVDHSMDQLLTSPAMWRYRPRITVDHFFREFHLHVETNRKRKDEFPVIRLFKAESHILRALHYVPAIMAGQKRLMMQLHRRLDRAEATTFSIRDAMRRKECAGLEPLMQNFSKAWEIVKEHLSHFRCPAPMEGLASLPEEYHNASITLNSPLAVLLPSTRGPGLCSYMLLQYLLGQHNDFLHRYCALIQQNPTTLLEVSSHAITERHLVGYVPERDLLPMVLAHCNYSLMVGKAATLEYDFAAFQQQLQDTLLQCKARVKRVTDGFIPVETMVYRADTTSSRLFRIIRDKIPQESLSPAERRQIVEELRDRVPDICQSIDNLNTALSFLKALGGKPDAPLHEFMATTLKMKHTILSHKAKQMCNLCHVQSLWILLCHHRASILATHHQAAFDNQELQKTLTEEQGLELDSMCQEMSIERLELLLFQLYECIMLRLSEAPDQEDGIQLQTFKLSDLLKFNLETPLYSVEPVEVRAGILTAASLATFPESLEGHHAATVWLICHAQLSHKRQQLM